MKKLNLGDLIKDQKAIDMKGSDNDYYGLVLNYNAEQITIFWFHSNSIYSHNLLLMSRCFALYDEKT